MVLFGTFAVLAWLSGNPTLLETRSSLRPLPLSTAFGFLVIGLGLCFLNVFCSRLALAAGSFTFLFGGFSLIYTFVFQPFSDNGLASWDSFHFQAMPPISALGFMFAGMALSAVTQRRLDIQGPLICGISGALVFFLGSIAFIANLIDLKQMNELGQWIRMGAHAPGAFGVLALGFIAFSWHNETSKVIGSPNWLPVLVGLGVLIVTFALWIHLDIQGPSPVPTGVLLFGLVMSTLLSLAVFVMQRERRWLERLSFSHGKLEDEIKQRILVEERLRNSEGELRNLSQRLQLIREEEKSKIAREVHDELGQILTVLKMNLSLLEKDGISSLPIFHEKIHIMGNLLDQSVQTVQRICLELRPKILELFGLPEAIEWQIKEFQKHTGIHCDLRIELGETLLNSESSLVCFRVLQEALTNVARHAQASCAQINVTKDNDQVRLMVKDNGKGIEEVQILDSKSLGLIGIRERVLQLKGEFRIQGKPGQGTELSITIPFASA